MSKSRRFGGSPGEDGLGAAATGIRARRTRCVGAAACAVAIFGAVATIHSQSPRPMTLIDLAELPRIILPQLSPDGRTLAYLQSSADWKASRPVWRLWRQAIGGAAPVQLTFAPGGDIPIQPRWSPDGRTIAFVRDGQLQLLGAEGGDARMLTRHATLPTAPSWTPDGLAIYFLATDPRTAEERDRDRVRDDVYGYDEDYKQRHLWKVVVSTGVETPITKGDWSVLEYRLSTDGKHIAFYRSATPLLDDVFAGQVWTMDADGAHARALTDKPLYVDQPSAQLSPDNSQLLFLADTNDRFEPYYNTNLFLVPAAGGVPRALLPDFRYAFDQATWAPDGKTIVAVVNMGVHNEVVQIDVASHAMRQLTSGDHFIPYTGWSIVPSAGAMVLQLDEPDRFGDVWTMRLDGTQPPTQVTHLFDRMPREFAIPRQEKIAWKSTDGTTIEGLLFYPAGYQEGTRYPTVVQMHGGPMESDKFGAGAGLFQNYFPVLTGKGYVVFRPNYRGSVGYGNAFYRDIVGGHFFEHMPQDILTGIDYLVERGVADPDRLVAMGWSAGGHLANKLITMTDRFKAVSSGASLANWTSFYAQTDVRSYRVTWFGGTPWDAKAPLAAFWDNSPLKDIAKAKTPTLLFVGENDSRVPLSQSIEMYRALKHNSVPTHLYVAPRDGHQWGELRHLLFKANAELEWFERYARGRSYTWEKAPQ
jgi:dipeptidyl aminopeptidase/acylaminoacyl peptidase